MIRRTIYHCWRRAGNASSLRPPPAAGNVRCFASAPLRSKAVESWDAHHALQATLEKQPPDELSVPERDLLQALRSANPKDRNTIDQLRDCYEALEYWDQALQTELLLHQESTSSAASLQRQGRFHLRLDQPVAARRVLQQALEIEPDNPSLWTSWAAWHYHTRDDCTTAIEHLETAVKLAREQDNIEQLVTCLQHQGLMWRDLGEHRTALDTYTRALALVDAPQQQEQYRSLRLDCADMHNVLEEWDAATQLYEELLQEDDQSDPAVRAVLLHNLGRLYTTTQHGTDGIPKARTYLQESIAIKRRHGATHGELAKTYNALGTLEAIHNPDKAIALSHFHDSLLLVRAEGGDNEHPLMLHALRNIAILKGKKVPKWQDSD